MKKFLCILLLSASMINGMNNNRPPSTLETIGTSRYIRVCQLAKGTIFSIPSLGLTYLFLSEACEGLGCMYAEYYGEECCLHPGISMVAGGGVLGLIGIGVTAYNYREALANR